MSSLRTLLSWRDSNVRWGKIHCGALCRGVTHRENHDGRDWCAQQCRGPSFVLELGFELVELTLCTPTAQRNNGEHAGASS